MILRIDDYPTGIRPVTQKQLDFFDRMLGEFDGLNVHLGIVPVTLLKFKNRPRNIIPCQHGYEHDHEVRNQILVEKNDPCNRSTFGTFDEFQDKNRHTILSLIRGGRQILEREYGMSIDTYIPVCNTINPVLVSVLEELGFKRILCENKIPSSIPILKSDFYGTLDRMDFTRRYDVITLHITWEWDTIQAMGYDYWLGLVRKLKACYKKEVITKPYRILFKYPIRDRESRFFSTLETYYRLMSDKKNFSFLVTIDRDDPVMNNPEIFTRLKNYRNLKFEVAGCTNKIQAVNYGIGDEKWDIVVIVSDDMIPQLEGYDDIIRQRMSEKFSDTDGCLWFNDGFQADHINTLQIAGRKWYDRWGFVYHEDYVSQRSDVEYQNLAKRFNRICYFPETIIRHEHADFGIVPYDRLLLHNYTFIRRDDEKYQEREKLGFPVKIPKIAHFIWSKGVSLSYLRYLTYKTFKDLHPDWSVRFHLVTGCGMKKTWRGKEELEFITQKGKDYLLKISKSEIIIEKVDGILPNLASDLIRWQALYKAGGFYFDLDQIFLKSFNPLTDYDIVWGGTRINYSGVVGMFRRCPVAEEMYERTKAKIESGIKDYCEAGNWLWSDYVDGENDLKYYKTLRTPMRFFYPVEESSEMKYYYDGGRPNMKDSYALHWFGGHPDSQEFNRLPENEIDKILKQWNI